MNRKTVPGREFRRPIMVRSRRESHHSDGITDPNNLQQISATKSAKSGHMQCGKQLLYSITLSACRRRLEGTGADRLGRLQIDNEFKPGRLLDREVGRLCTAQNFGGQFSARANRCRMFAP